MLQLMIQVELFLTQENNRKEHLIIESNKSKGRLTEYQQLNDE